MDRVFCPELASFAEGHCEGSSKKQIDRRCQNRRQTQTSLNTVATPGQTVGRYLHQSDSSHEEDQREPLVETQPFPQHRNRKQRCGENLQLVCDLSGAQNTNTSTETGSEAVRYMTRSATSNATLSNLYKVNQ